tara:strand:+ start:44 stop:1225 length:1182 start_codon:yes stop_codon:yes gene_type:complete
MADKTALFESSQALFCAVADYLGKVKTNKIFDLKKVPDYNTFRSAVGASTINLSSKRLDTPGVTLKDIESFLTDDLSWYTSSLLIAKKLVNDITDIDKDLKLAPAGFQKLFYFRGDSDVMGNIEQLFKVANKSGYRTQAKFGNVNKWSPADIYLASPKAKTAISKELQKAKPKIYTFQNLNILVSDLIDTGDLLPLSLKKVTKTDVKLQKVNFDRKDEIKVIKGIAIKSVTDWKPYKKVKYGQKAETRDMRIFLQTGGEIKLRHDPSAKRFVAETIFSKAEARGGSIGSIKVFCEILRFVDPKLAADTLRKYTAGEQEYFKALAKIEYLRKDKKRFDFERGAISAIFIINKIMPDLKRFFKENKQDKANQFLRLAFEYITSRTPLSGQFVIAK